MDEETLKRALDPFYTNGVKHPGRSVGLGLPFVRQMVEAIGGTFQIESERGVGTRIAFTVPTDHVDAPPIGDVATVLKQLLCFDGAYEMTVRRRTPNGAYTLVRSELRDALGELDTVGSQSLLEEYIRSQEESTEDNVGEAEAWQR